MKTTLLTPAIRPLLACLSLLAAAQACAQEAENLAGMINAYRANPGMCDGKQARPQPALVPVAALGKVQLAAGTFLDQALERAGYPVARAEVISISGVPDARSAMDAIAGKYCATLSSSRYSAIGTRQTRESWLIVLAQPAPPPPALLLPAPREAGLAILRAVNDARASERLCGARQFAAAPSLSWSGALGDAALAHSKDMAKQRYFSHRGKDGREVSDRALGAGYRWRRIGENIAVGQDSAGEVVAGWLSSPGHCENIMNAGFTEMGAAYAVNTTIGAGRVYWTQVLGTPR